MCLTNKLETEQFFLSLFVSTAKMPRHRKQQETVAAAVGAVAAVAHQWKTSHRFWLVLRLIKARLSDQAISKSWWRQLQQPTTNKQRKGDTETVFFLLLILLLIIFWVFLALSISHNFSSSLSFSRTHRESLNFSFSVFLHRGSSLY